jgi:L-threonylcarbamoyladenylate synthase
VTTQLLRVDLAAPDADAVAQAAAVLRSGGLVAFPTETVYGLGANALDAEAVTRIFTAKGRPATNPVIVHVADVADVATVSTAWPASAAALAERFLPGPLTLVLPRGPAVPDVVTAGGPTVAVRCPSHPVARALIRAAGVPVAAPSANRSTELSPTRAEHVMKGLDGRINLVLDGGPCPGGIESTVVDVTGEQVRLLRPGLVTAPMVVAVVGPLGECRSEAGVARSPGQQLKHYAPRTPIRLITPGVVLPAEDGVNVLSGMPSDPMAFAAVLYAKLHELDGKGFARIVIELPPDTAEWAGVRDRLIRAASPAE